VEVGSGVLVSVGLVSLGEATLVVLGLVEPGKVGLISGAGVLSGVDALSFEVQLARAAAAAAVAVNLRKFRRVMGGWRFIVILHFFTT